MKAAHLDPATPNRQKSPRHFPGSSVTMPRTGKRYTTRKCNESHTLQCIDERVGNTSVPGRKPGTQHVGYADDIVQWTTGKDSIIRMQHSLNILANSMWCNWVHNIATQDQKPMQRSATHPWRSFISRIKTDWVATHRYLGVVVSRNGTSKAEVKHLKEKCYARNRVLERHGPLKRCNPHRIQSLGALGNRLRKFHPPHHRRQRRCYHENHTERGPENCPQRTKVD